MTSEGRLILGNNYLVTVDQRCVIPGVRRCNHPWEVSPRDILTSQGYRTPTGGDGGLLHRKEMLTSVNLEWLAERNKVHVVITEGPRRGLMRAPMRK